MPVFEKIPDALFVLIHSLIPQHFLSRIVYRLTRLEWSPWKNILIRSFINAYEVDMTQALEEDYRSFPSFNHFFTRELKPHCRPLSQEKDKIICPVDGSVSQMGLIKHTTLIQAKGHDYSLETLVAGDPSLVSCFTDGAFATLYLSPRDYHRIHMPLCGELSRMTYVPGDLFPVNETSVNTVKNVFARNERLINCFNTELGKLAVIMVGALCVGSMETVWAGQISPVRKRFVFSQDYQPSEVILDRGQEIGRFNMGSTIILLFEPDRIVWNRGVVAESPVVMGEAIGDIRA